MSKGIIVVDLPEYCIDCEFCRELHEGIEACCEISIDPENNKYLRSIEDYCQSKPDWCPIKPLPEKLPEHEPVAYKDSDDNWVSRMKRLPEHCGWNACLDAIMEECNGE